MYICTPLATKLVGDKQTIMHCVNKVLKTFGGVITIIETMKNTYLIGSQERERSDARLLASSAKKAC
jgi:hypothetical protein